MSYREQFPFRNANSCIPISFSMGKERLEERKGENHSRRLYKLKILWQFLYICCCFSGSSNMVIFLPQRQHQQPQQRRRQEAMKKRRNGKKAKLSTFYLIKSCKETFIYCYPCGYLLTSTREEKRKKKKKKTLSRERQRRGLRERTTRTTKRNENKRTCIRPCIRKTMLLIRHSVPFLWMNLKILSAKFLRKFYWFFLLNRKFFFWKEESFSLSHFPHCFPFIFFISSRLVKERSLRLSLLFFYFKNKYHIPINIF